MKPKRTFPQRFWLLVIPAVGLMSGCTHHAPIGDVDKAASQFFLRLKNAEYGAIYDDAADKFKESKSQAEVKDDLEKLVGFGRPEKWARISLSFSDNNKSHFANPNYMVNTDYMTVSVTLTFLDDDGEWKLMGFTASPHGPRAL